LLSAVGHPVVVNPDPRLSLMAAARRWPLLDLAGPGMARIPIVNLEVQRLALSLLHPSLFPYLRLGVEGVERIPTSGPAILVGNHRSYFDPVAIALLLARTNRTVRFLGKKEVFDAPVVGQIAAAMGGIRVDRGTGSDAPLRAAADALAAGDLVAMMPQGTIPRGAAFYEPVLKGRWGAARLAAMTGAPVIPLGLWGTEKVWPRSARVPNVLNIIDPPHVSVVVGSPVTLAHRSESADTARMMKAIMALLPAESRSKRVPTAEEIALAMPPGSASASVGGE
jgi:putative phosphoserine phosphatase/1-acylglycerol-3-phosphate O-acyltransferase